MRFSELFARMASRVEIVVTFLALLELIRLKQVRAIQPDEFEEIEIAPVRKLMPRDPDCRLRLCRRRDGRFVSGRGMGSGRLDAFAGVGRAVGRKAVRRSCNRHHKS